MRQRQNIYRERVGSIAESAPRVSKKPQTVKICVNGNRKQRHCEATCGRGNPFFLRPRKACCARYFDLLRKPDSTVPMYADESGLLVFAAPLTSASLSKKNFLPGFVCASLRDGLLAFDKKLKGFIKIDKEWAENILYRYKRARQIEKLNKLKEWYRLIKNRGREYRFRYWKRCFPDRFFRV